MVCTNRYPGDLCSVFSCARSAACAGTHDDARGRRRDAGVVHETDAARGRSRVHVRLSTDASEKMAAMFRSNIAKGNAEHVPATPVQPQLRDAFGGLVRAESSGRRFCRDICCLAHARARLAQRLCWLAGTAKVGILGRAVALTRRQAAPAYARVSRCRLRLSQRQAQDVLHAKAQAQRRYVSEFLRCRSATAFRRACWNQGKRISSTATEAITECSFPMDQRKEISGKPTPCEAYQSM